MYFYSHCSRTAEKQTHTVPQNGNIKYKYLKSAGTFTSLKHGGLQINDRNTVQVSVSIRTAAQHLSAAGGIINRCSAEASASVESLLICQIGVMINLTPAAEPGAPLSFSLNETH